MMMGFALGIFSEFNLKMIFSFFIFYYRHRFEAESLLFIRSLHNEKVINRLGRNCDFFHFF